MKQDEFLTVPGHVLYRLLRWAILGSLFLHNVRRSKVPDSISGVLLFGLSNDIHRATSPVS